LIVRDPEQLARPRVASGKIFGFQRLDQFDQRTKRLFEGRINLA